MKKISIPYILAWYGFPTLLFASLLAASFFGLHENLGIVMLLLLFVGIPVGVPILLERRMRKRAATLEREFSNISWKFTACNCVVYLDAEGGNIGMVWKHNPARLQMVDPEKLSDIRTNNGQQLRGTQMVSCQFLLNGKKVKIYTLWVSKQLSMKDRQVLDAVSNADKLGDALRAVQEQRMRKKLVDTLRAVWQQETERIVRRK